ncbi:MAG: glycosyltransferase family 1 protein [Acidobacteria bacterium]|nr:glycosyltransferase family 1 protein [Acidobacteriota bacterium]
MNVILAATPAVGHVNPMLSVAKILIENGHNVRMMTGSFARERVEKAGIRFVPLPEGADFHTTDLDEVFPERKNIPAGPPQLYFDFMNFFLAPIPAQFAALKQMLEQEPADLILVDVLFAGALPFLTGNYPDRPAIAGLGVTILPLVREDGLPFGPGLPLATTDEQRSQYAAIAAQINEMLLDPVRSRCDEILASLGSKPLPMPYLDALVHLPDAYLQPSVPGLDFPRTHLPENLNFIGALPAPAGAPIPQHIKNVLKLGKKVVLVTQGTVANHDLGQVVAPAIQALADREDVLVLATAGGRKATDIPCTIPANCITADYLPIDRLMPHVDLLVTNGGFGTVSQALQMGVPVIVAGATEDKPEVAARVEYAGAGLNLSTGTPTVEQLRNAIAEVLSGEQYKLHAMELASEFSQYDASGSILELLTTAAQNSRELALV